MRRSLLLAVVVAAFMATLPRPAAAAVSVDISLFHDALAPHGHWLVNARFGDVWTPSHLPHDWRPYTVGRWVYTDYDWTWESDEDWGWATYHYGRWVFDQDEGWLWVPGEEWAPAWVAWREGGGYVGWAPLPPDFDVAYDVAIEPRLDPFAFAFVEERYLSTPGLFARIVPVGRNYSYVRLTTNFTRYSRVDRRIVNHGIEVGRIERVTGHAVPRLRVETLAGPSRTRELGGGRLGVFRPTPGVVVHGGVPRPASPPARVERDHRNETRAFEKAEGREQRTLVNTQRREERRPPPDVSRDELRARHEAEQRAQAEHAQRERQQLEHRQQREQPRAQERQPQKREQHRDDQQKEKKGGSDKHDRR